MHSKKKNLMQIVAIYFHLDNIILSLGPILINNKLELKKNNAKMF